MIDNITKTETVANRTDVQLFGMPAFIGGRPGRLSPAAARGGRRGQLPQGAQNSRVKIVYH